MRKLPIALVSMACGLAAIVAAAQTFSSSGEIALFGPDGKPLSHEPSELDAALRDRWSDASGALAALDPALLCTWRQHGKDGVTDRMLGRGESAPGASGFSVLEKARSGPWAGQPDPFVWLSLFAPRHLNSIRFLDEGAASWGGTACRRISFCGAFGGSEAMEPARWEGKVWVDGRGRPLHLEAEPAGQARRLAVLEDKYRTATVWVFFKAAKKPRGVRWTVDFAPGPEGLWLPSVSRWERFQVDVHGVRTSLELRVDEFLEPRLARVDVEVEREPRPL